jgi:hypothetical protein
MFKFDELNVGELFFDEITGLVFEKICGNVGESKRELGKPNALCTFDIEELVTKIKQEVTA